MAIFILHANPHQVYSWRKHLGRTAEPCAQTWSIFTHVHFSYWDFSEPPSESSHISRDRAILIQFALTLSDIVSWSRHMSLDLVTQGCVCVCVCVCAQSCPTPLDPTDCSPPGSSVHGILLARILKWVAISYSRGSSQPKDQTWVSGISWVGKWVLYHCTTWAALVSQDMVSKLWFQPAWEVMMVTWGSWFSHLIKNGQF